MRARKSACRFFELLRGSGAQRIVDVRLNNVSQLAGFAKKDDLAFFAREIAGLEYIHLPQLAPTQAMLDAWRQEHRDWNRYEDDFLALMRARRIEESVPREAIAGGCLLCSEDQPHRCHRRLVAEYLRERWGAMEIVHLA